MPLVHPCFPRRAAGSEVHSVPLTSLFSSNFLRIAVSWVTPQRVLVTGRSLLSAPPLLQTRMPPRPCPGSAILSARSVPRRQVLLLPIPVGERLTPGKSKPDSTHMIDALTRWTYRSCVSVVMFFDAKPGEKIAFWSLGPAGGGV
jgi:hypothetical protein